MLNDSIRVVAPARNGKTCWFSLFLHRKVCRKLNFIDGVYDLSRGDDRTTGAFAVLDNIFSRRGVDHGALVEVIDSKANRPQ